MKLNKEHETEVFLNNAGGVSVAQTNHVCPSCDVVVMSYVCFGDVARIRAVAKEMLRLADELEKGAA